MGIQRENIKKSEMKNENIIRFGEFLYVSLLGESFLEIWRETLGRVW